METLILQTLFSFLATVAFGVLTNIPKKALVTAGITGAVGWVIYWGSMTHGQGLGTSNFLAAVGIGTFSVIFSRMLKMPTIIFNIPALVPLVPGGPAYKAVREMVMGNANAAFNNFVIVLITAGAIAAGFMATGLLESIVWRIVRKSRRGRL